MNNSFFFEKSFFIPALLLSAAIHGFLFGASSWMASMPQAAVIHAPNSLEVTVINHPVVTVIEEEIVSEEIIESKTSEAVVFNGQIQESIPEKRLLSQTASRESRGAVTKAEPLARINPAPLYPHLARQRGWEGIVRLEVFVGKDGIPGQVGIKESSGYGVLDRAASEAVQNWKFSPAQSGSMKFSSRITIPIQFTLVRE